MLGASVAQVACKRPVREIPGSIRGASHAVGHKLKDLPSLGEPSVTVRVPVVIVGAGPSGLSAAWRLRRLGEERVVVLDLEATEGGTSSFGDDGVVPYPWGAHYVPAPRKEHTALVTLLRELGAITGEDRSGNLVFAEDMLVRDPEERVFHRGVWYDGLYLKAGASDDDLAQLARFQNEISRFVSFRDTKGRRAFDIPMEHATDDSEITSLDRITMSQWLEQHGFTSSRLKWLVDYACRDDYGLHVESTSAWAGLFYFASRVSGPGDEAADLFAWPQGNGRVVQHLSSSCPGVVRARRLVVDVATFDDHAEVIAFDLEANRVEKYMAERVIYAAPKFLAPRVLRSFREQRPSWVDQMVYGPWMVANLHMSAHPTSRGVPIAWDNVLYDSPSLGYVVATHQTMVDEGPTVLTYYYPYAQDDAKKARETLLSTEHAAFVELILADMAPAHKGFLPLVQRIDVWRWGHAMVQPRPGLVWGGTRQRATQAVGRIHMAHSDLSGLALLEEALHHGVRAAEEVYEKLYPNRTWTRLG
ncbi:MAG: FAD-dependent oxidoreductase [Polyangiaceae bacterium]